MQSAVIGSPTLLVSEGHLLSDHLAKQGLTESELLQALRDQGVDDLVAVKSAVLELDGTISVVPRDAPSSHTRRRIRGRKSVG